MDKIANIIKKAQIGVCKSNLLQPSQDSDILGKLEMPHFCLLDIIIGPIQRLKRRNSELNCWCTIKDRIDSLTKALNISCEMKDDILDGICLFGLIFFDNLSKVELNADNMFFSEIVSSWFFSFSERFSHSNWQVSIWLIMSIILGTSMRTLFSR